MIHFFRFTLQFAKQEKGKIALIFIFVTLSQIFSLAEPFFFTRILDGFLRRIGDKTLFPTEAVFFRQISIIVIIWIGVAFAARTFKNLQMFFVDTVSDRIGIRIFEHTYRHTLALPLSFHSSYKPGEVLRKISKGREDVTKLFSVFFDKIFQNSFAIVLVTAYVFWRSWHLGLALVAFVPLFFGVTYLFTKKIRRTQNEINLANEQIFGTSIEAMNNIEVVKSFATDKQEAENVGHDNRLSHQNLKKKSIAFQTLGFWQGTIVNLARVVLLWYGSILAFRGVVSFADVILFTFYSFAVYQPLYDIGGIYSQYMEGISAVDRLQTLLSEPVTITSPASGLKPNKLRGEVEFRRVSFAYGGGREKILSDVSFKIAPGDKLAIVGLSGGGKSSIIKLLLRFYDPMSGEILIDGENIQKYDLTSLHRRIGLVLQDNVLFNTSLEENIKYGTPKATGEEIATAAKRAYLSDLLERLPEKLKTLVGERGLKLSGGEKQRVAIARAIIKKPDILIFDEATSSLDSHSEEMIKRAIGEVSRDITSVTVAHRFATVLDADEIILLRAGKIIERGNHGQLLTLKGEYARLYNLQTQRQHAEEEVVLAEKNLAAERMS
ncbi:MAG: ABC transporter ATP-binding protein [Patescibacteria group bacterium]